jgi:acyl-CoA reductase-like NAD-dependent aldehyde dehydrogenase
MNGLSFGTITAGAAHPTATPASAKTNPAAEDFLKYMKESPAERMADSWLAAHGLSKEKLAAMSPEQRAAALKQMAKELQDQVADATRDTLEKTPSPL